MASKAAELRELPDEELYVRIDGAKEELFNLRFQLATGQLDNTARLRELRLDVARVMTVLRERQVEAELEAELARVEAASMEQDRHDQEAGKVHGTPLAEMERESLDEAPKDEAADDAEEDEA